MRTVPGNLRERPRQVLLGASVLVVAVVGPAAVVAPPLVLEVASLVGALLVGAAAAGLPR